MVRKTVSVSDSVYRGLVDVIGRLGHFDVDRIRFELSSGDKAIYVSRVKQTVANVRLGRIASETGIFTSSSQLNTYTFNQVVDAFEVVCYKFKDFRGVGLSSEDKLRQFSERLQSDLREQNKENVRLRSRMYETIEELGALRSDYGILLKTVRRVSSNMDLLSIVNEQQKKWDLLT